MITPRCSSLFSRDSLRSSLLKIHPQCRAFPQQIRHRRPTSTQSIPKASSKPARRQLPFSRNTTSAYYATAVLVTFLGLTYASVPIYRIVCQRTGWGGTPMTDSSKFSPEHMVPVKTASGRRIRVTFSASTSDSLPWSFRPLQREISLLPGETALAFYKARNWGKEDIIGIATYNVLFIPPAISVLDLVIDGRLIQRKWLRILTKSNASALKNKNSLQARRFYPFPSHIKVNTYIPLHPLCFQRELTIPCTFLKC